MISLIVPVFNDRSTLVELYDRLSEVMRQVSRDYEVIFVDDASTDGSFETISNLFRKDKRIRALRLRNNCGQPIALSKGFEYSRGDVLVSIDADLQYDPADILKLLQKIDCGFDAVFARRRNRKDRLLWRVLPSLIANLIARFKLKKCVRDIGCFFIAVKKDVFLRIGAVGYQVRFLKPLLANEAHSFCEVEVEHNFRKTGKSKYPFLRLVKVALDCIVNFRNEPDYGIDRNVDVEAILG